MVKAENSTSQSINRKDNEWGAESELVGPGSRVWHQMMSGSE